MGSAKGYRTLVLWLEETKIRHYSIEQRAGLREIDGEEAWKQAFRAYLNDLEFDETMTQFNEAELKVAMEWLVSKAISLEYNDKKDLYNAKTPSWTKSVCARISLTEENQGILRDLASLVGRQSDGIEDPGMMANVVLSEVEKRFSRMATANAIKASKRAKGTEDVDETKLTSKHCAIGLSTGNANVDKACRLLRLAYIQKLRTLQDRINRGLAQGQSLTANPKTNTRLGKVGYG